MTFFRFLYVNKIKYPNFDIKFVIYAKFWVKMTTLLLKVGREWKFVLTRTLQLLWNNINHLKILNKEFWPLKNSKNLLLLKCTLIKTSIALRGLPWLIINWNCFNLCRWYVICKRWYLIVKSVNKTLLNLTMSFWLLYGHYITLVASLIAR